MAKAEARYNEIVRVVVNKHIHKLAEETTPKLSEWAGGMADGACWKDTQGFDTLCADPKLILRHYYAALAKIPAKNLDAFMVAADQKFNGFKRSSIWRRACRTPRVLSRWRVT